MKALYKKISKDYEFDVIQALRDKNFTEIAKRLPLFLWDKVANKTYILTNIECKSSLTDPEQKYYLVLKSYHTYTTMEYGLGSWDCDYPDTEVKHEELAEAKKLLTEELLANLLPGFTMTDKQRACLLNVYKMPELQVNNMCGKEAWTIINNKIKDSKEKATHQKQTFRKLESDYDEYDDEYDTWNSWLQVKYCGGGH